MHSAVWPKCDLSEKVHITIPAKVPKEGDTESLHPHFNQMYTHIIAQIYLGILLKHYIT